MVDLSDVNQGKQSSTADIYFEARWFDPRVAHEGAGEITKQRGEVWNPEFSIVNRRSSLTATLPDIVKISPQGNVTYRQRVNGEFSQPLDLKDFPFDRQEFRVQVVSPLTSSKLEIIADSKLQSRVAGTVTLPDWTIEDWSISFEDFRLEPGGPAHPAFGLRFLAKRKQGYFVYKIILPLMLIVSMSWVVFWIPLSATAPRIGLPATVMLTLIAYRYSIDQILPQISYLTRIDLFIILATILVYIALIETAIATALHGKERKEWARRLDRVCRFVFPILFVLCSVATLIW